MQAVRAAGDDGPLVGPRLAQHLDVGFGHFEEQILVAGPPGNIAGAHLLIAQHGEIHPGRMQHGGNGPGNVLRVRVKGAGAADPIQHLVLRVVFDRWDCEGQRLRPGQAILAHLPRVAVALHPGKGGLELGGETALHQHLVAPDVEDVEHGLIADRADLDTGAAACACPHRALVDGVVHQFGAVLAAAGEQVEMLADVIALVDFERGRGERLAGRIRRAGVLATIAHDAGEGIQDVLLAEVGQFGRPKLLDAFVIEVDRLERAEGLALGFDHEVERTHEQVGVFGIGKVGQKGQDQAEGQPPARMPAGLERNGRKPHPEPADQPGDRLPGVGRFGDVKGRAEQAEADVKEDEDADDERVAHHPAGGHLGML